MQNFNHTPSSSNHCQHILANGRRCQRPSLRRPALGGGKEPYCFHHQNAHRPLPGVGRRFRLPPLEDRASIQLAVSAVISLIVTGEVDSRRAGLLLYALQIATSALSGSGLAPNQDPDPDPDPNPPATARGTTIPTLQAVAETIPRPEHPTRPVSHPPHPHEPGLPHLSSTPPTPPTPRLARTLSPQPDRT